MDILYIVLGLIFIETTFIAFRIWKKAPIRGEGRRKAYIDSSALMDGRILQIAKSGFISDNLIIPRSVIREMQLLADGKNSEKRARARYGLDIINELERVIFVDVSILQDSLKREFVDERLLQLAKENRGVIISNDYNLQKVAKTEKIDVLNVNELASLLQEQFLPGEKLKIKITGVGSSAGQGVGYLPNGTMVVVDGAKNKVGKEVLVEFVRFIQSNSGRMMFGKIAKK